MKETAGHENWHSKHRISKLDKTVHGAAFDVGSSVMLRNHFEWFCSQIKGDVSRNSAKLGNYEMPVKLKET